MSQTITETRQAIRDIDRQIDAARDELLSREAVDRLSAASWQRAWDRHPELRQRECGLFLKRRELQLTRSQLEAAAARRESRRPRPKKCTACGGSGYAKAA